MNRAPDRDDRALFVRYREGGDAAIREALVERFLPLAYKLAARYRRGPEPLDDLRQVAALGLLKAIDRYDPAHGTAFSSFAVPTILGGLRRHFRDTGWAIHVPRDLQELALRLDGTIDELQTTLGRTPTVAEIAERLNTTPEQVLEARTAAAARHAASLETPISDGEDLTQSEIGARLGISQMHVSRLIRQSLKQLRDVAEAEAEPLGAAAA